MLQATTSTIVRSGPIATHLATGVAIAATAISCNFFDRNRQLERQRRLEIFSIRPNLQLMLGIGRAVQQDIPFSLL